MNLEVDDIQGNIIVGYRLEKVAHLFAPVTADNLAACRAFLKAVEVTPAASWDAVRPHYTVNVALSYEALAQLNGDPDGKIRATFPAFAGGMRTRATLLRDPHIETWANRHLWVAVHAMDGNSLQEGVDYIKGIGPQFDNELRGAAIVEGGHWFEHFGFRDDIANPVVEGVEAIRAPKDLTGNGKRDEAGNWIPLKAGEFVLGYPNESNEVNPASALMSLFKNGTFAVFRDLQQNVPAFRDYTTEQGRRLGLDPSDLASKIIGRRQDGATLVDTKGPPNDFDYQSDPKGQRCPLGAHVRRVNHRERKVSDGGRHRLIRRGRPYGDPVGANGSANTADPSSRGLYFVGLNASIEDQYEVIHRRWINDRASTEGDIDPLVGVRSHRMFVIEGQEPPLTLIDIPDFVTFRGGEYYFLPGIKAMKTLAQTPDSRTQP